MLREEDGAVALPGPQSFDQQGCGAGPGGVQLVNHPKHAVDAQSILSSDSAEERVAR